MPEELPFANLAMCLESSADDVRVVDAKDDDGNARRAVRVGLGSASNRSRAAVPWRRSSLLTRETVAVLDSSPAFHARSRSSGNVCGKLRCIVCLPSRSGNDSRLPNERLTPD